MNFQVLSAYDNTSRTFYVSGARNQGESFLWGAAINGNVTKATLVTSSTLQYPNHDDILVRIHALQSSGQLLAVFANGNVLLVNSSTGQATPLGNLLTASPSLAGGAVFPASAMDYTRNLLYSLATTSDMMHVYLVTLNVASGVSTAALLSLKREQWDAETYFQGVFIPNQNVMVVLAQAGSNVSGFDQIINVSPDGTVAYVYENIQDAGNYAFNTVSAVKNDDTLQTACYDPLSNRLYFQATVYQDADDDVGTESMVFIDYNLRFPYITVNISPLGFEYEGWFYVPILN